MLGFSCLQVWDSSGLCVLGSKIQYWIINWIMFFVKIQWIFGRSKVKRGRKRVKGGKITLLDFTGFFKK